MASTTAATSAWHNLDFRRLWFGETISRLGTQVSVLALPLVAIISLDASPQEVGALGALQFVPGLVVTPLAGVLFDRRRRQPLLVATSVARAVVVAAVPAAAATGHLSVGLLYVVAALLGALTAMFDVGYLAYLPSLVGREQLVSANGLMMSSYSAAHVAGPGLGGVLVAWLTAPVAVAVDAVSYAVAALTMARIRRREAAAVPGPSRRIARDIVEGLRTLFGDRRLRALTLTSASFNMFEKMLLVVFLLYASRDLSLSPSVIGAVLMAGGVGTLAGSLVAARLGLRLGVGATLTAGMAAACGAPALVPLARGAAAVPLLLVAFFVYGLGLAVFNVHAISFRQLVAPSDQLGRVNASYRLVAFGTIPLGSLAAGALSAAAGERAALWAAVGGLLAGAIGLACSSLARTRTVEPASAPAATA